MAYYRFTRLQQYINGQPTDVYSKGERVDDVDYDTYDGCMDGTTNTRWIPVSQTVCYNGDLWSMEKEQISYDEGAAWTDTGNTRRASVIEQSSSQCSGANNDWRVVYGEYICNGTTKCVKEAEYVNDSPTGRTRAGSMVELLSEDCGVMHQWVDVPGEFICVYKCGRADKYTKQKQQYSIDGGLHWEDTGETREGDFIERNSADCGCDTSITRWITVSGEYVCVGTSKYTKEKEQTSTDGTNWTDTGNTRAGSLIEASSTDCGYVPPIKATLIYQNGDTYDILENGDSMLTVSEVRRGISDTSDVHHYTKITGVVVHDTVNALVGSFEQCTNLASITLPSTALEIYGNTFIYCESLGSITLGNNITLHDGGANTFSHCNSLTNITIPSSIKKLPYGFLSLCENLKTVTIEATDFEMFDNDVFFGCESLESITLKATVPPAFGYQMLYNVPANIKIYVPCDSLNAYKTASGWSDYADRIQCEPDYSTEYLTTEALGSGDISLKIERSSGTGQPITNIQYSKNNGAWTSYTYGTQIPVVNGDKIRWKGTRYDGNAFHHYSYFDSTADYKVYGNPLSLLKNDSFVDEPDSLYDYAYYFLFEKSSTLKDASNLVLPATTLEYFCYAGMFNNCTSLTTAPALPATTLAESCYGGMFYGCTSLTTAPELPANTLYEGCYGGMFAHCTSLNYIKCLATDKSASNCTESWTWNVASSGTFVKNSSMTGWTTGIRGIPSGWTVQDAS